MPAPPERPNVLFILTDDQGPWAAGCYGNPEIRTPSLDRLAASGMRFERFFVASPVCSPSRATLLTGRISSQHGVHDWIRGGNMGEDAARYLEGIGGNVIRAYACDQTNPTSRAATIRALTNHILLFSHLYT